MATISFGEGGQSEYPAPHPINYLQRPGKRKDAQYPDIVAHAFQILLFPGRNVPLVHVAVDVALISEPEGRGHYQDSPRHPLQLGQEIGPLLPSSDAPEPHTLESHVSYYP